MTAALHYPDELYRVVSLVITDGEGFPPYRIDVSIAAAPDVDDHTALVFEAAQRLAEYAFQERSP